MLKSKLYGTALDRLSLDLKIDHLKEDINGKNDEVGRIKSEFIERFSEFIFKLHNLGVQDMKN